ncbi:hypothetical protein JIN84_20605 [Luteolibacter yonseiensis]|uniref:Bulb-type lectin domain-containing protein n=1 Tax=Luteolibacter yonseiensis TaxID=1144680 RepID=A0A934R6B3_9BACT|nr:hypothetical protein [Luteolibacter yonseiensis]MBK1818036.1 hypothetical protein [Luteolibacter yonseiensis]
MNRLFTTLCSIGLRFPAGVVASLGIAGPAFALPLLKWSTPVDTGASTSDRIKAVGMTNGGDVIAASQISSGTGAQIRVQRLPGAGGAASWTRDVGAAGLADDVVAIAVDPSTGDSFVAARSASALNGLDWLVFKINGNNGTLAWTTSHTYATTGNDQPRAITFTPDNNIVVAGMETNPVNGGSRLRVTKINSSTGSQIWNHTSTIDGTDAAAVAADPSGNVAVAGRNGQDAFVVSLGGTGTVNWSQTYNGAGNGYDAWNAVTFLSTGDLAVAGYVTGATGGQNFCVARYPGAGGGSTWIREVNGSANSGDLAYDIVRDTSNNLYAAGLLRNSATGQTAYIAKLAGATGSVTWSFAKNGGNTLPEATDAFFSVRLLGDDVLTAGCVADPTNKSNILVSRFTTAGVFADDTVFDGTAHNNDFLLSRNLLTTAGTSLFAIGGDSENSGAISDGLVRSYLIPTPIESWRQTWYGTPASSGNAKDTADPYKTGIQNLHVFAFFGPNQNPATARIGLLPKIQRIGGNLSTSFTQPSGVGGITYGAESSTTLLPGSWQAVPDTGIPPQHVFSIPAGNNPRLFLRLKVTDP